MTPVSDSASKLFTPGLLAGIGCYLIWGFFPVYFKATDSVSAVEILAHRIVWSLPFALLVLAARKQLGETWAILRDWGRLRWLLLSALCICVNWGLYIWAIQMDRIFEASLGYYINPLIYVLVGIAVFGEALTRAQVMAVALATFGVGWLTVAGGVFPWVSLTLATTFTVYGVVRKQVAVGAMPGLAVEVAVVFAPALAYLLWLGSSGALTGFADARITTLMLVAGPLTVIPLFLFAFAARRIKLSTLGFLQFLGPTLQFALGLFYGEAFTPAHAVCFGAIWAAVAVFIWGAWRARPARKPA